MAQKRIRSQQEQKDPVIYIAGPFRAANAWLIEQNVRAAEHASVLLWQAKVANHCPHVSTRYYNGLMPDHVFLRGEIAIMKLCHALLMLANWRESSGARKEHRIAKKMGKPIFYNIQDAIRWAKSYRQ